ncbi:VOC family protein [Flavitalea sp.]|nr:hypothetical protein [Flavitalea sp.]
MSLTNNLKFRFHHLGIPTNTIMPGERYNSALKMYTTDNPGSFRIQYHRFDPGCPLHPLIQTMPHVALEVDDLNTAIEGKKLLLGPYEPITGYKVAIIDDAGVPVELVETILSDEFLWQILQ